MIVSFRKLASRLQFTLLFLALTTAVFAGERALLRWAHWSDPYAPPTGAAQKVFHYGAAQPERLGFLERLRWFYWIGE